MTGKNRIMIYGPKADGTYVVEFRTAEGEALAIHAMSALVAGAYSFNRHVHRAWKNLNEVRENPSRW